MTNLNTLRLKLKYETLYDMGFIFFFASPLINFAIKLILSFVGFSWLSMTLTCMVIYIPVILAVLLTKRIRAKDFYILLALIILFYLITYAIHPEYQFHYERSYYGTWDYVLRPDNGLYAYLFIRLINDPKRIIRNMRISGWIMYIYLAYQLQKALRVGYWEIVYEKGTTYHASYDLTFGYMVLTFTLVYLYSAIKTKNKSDIIGSIIGVVMIILGGSRGPWMCIAVFVALLFIQNIGMTRKKLLQTIAVLSAVLLVAVFYEQILSVLSDILQKSGNSSRTLEMLISGNIADDNSRLEIWQAAADMIKDNPLGYGFMGTRHKIYHIVSVGHPHQIFLEMLVDFGVIVGGFIIVYALIESAKIILVKKYREWSGVFIVFFARACQLLISLSYWHEPSFWGCIALGVCCFSALKRGKQQNLKERTEICSG